MISAVLDTNVVVSAHLNSEGPAALILDLALARHFRLFLSEVLLEEYTGVLARARFGLDPHDLRKSIRAIRRAATFVHPRRTLCVTRDIDDNRVVECALKGRADFIVTGNLRHFPARFQDIRVIPPRQFLTILASEPC